MVVYLYRVGRNLNRAYRTAEAFGVSRIVLIECSAPLQGHLFGAAGRVDVTVGSLPSPTGLLALETTYKTPLRSIDWQLVEGILIGGETAGVPRGRISEFQVVIPTVGQVSGLTVEAALAIALWEWRMALPC